MADLLGTDLMVVGTNAWLAYQLVCGAMFPTGVEETEDFDLIWIRGSQASLQFSRMQPRGDEPYGGSALMWADDFEPRTSFKASMSRCAEVAPFDWTGIVWG